MGTRLVAIILMLSRLAAPISVTRSRFDWRASSRGSLSWAFEEFNVLAQKARLTVLEVVILSGNVRWKSKDERKNDHEICLNPDGTVEILKITLDYPGPPAATLWETNGAQHY
ncbi:hypothetical protein RRG08_027135 [Elysia crispata]|uniref:Uncharacterized protein n=1 Tax=Elysia crispata TaxID=231223 RepID=A0AAE0YUX1_9GAST|nr:hypothetical protein RRG08_027135 [Elysia crispata]